MDHLSWIQRLEKIAVLYAWHCPNHLVKMTLIFTYAFFILFYYFMLSFQPYESQPCKLYFDARLGYFLT